MILIYLNYLKKQFT